jgi:hypothetical protein
MKARLLILVKFLTLQNEDDTVFSFKLWKGQCYQGLVNCSQNDEGLTQHDFPATEFKLRFSFHICFG